MILKGVDPGFDLVSPTHLLLGVTFKTDGDRLGLILVQIAIIMIMSMLIKTMTMILM